MQDEPHALDYGHGQLPRLRGSQLGLAAFIFGNVWLLSALAMFLECKFARSAPDMVSFMASGAWLDPGTYHTLNALCLVAAAGCFWLAAASRKAA